MRFELEPNNRDVPDELLLDDLRRVALLLQKASLTRAEYEGVGRFGANTLKKRFGGWNKAIERAGLRIKIYKNTAAEDLLSDLRAVARMLGKNFVTIKEYGQRGKYTDKTFRRTFGSWVLACGAAGLSITSHRSRRPNDDEYFHNLEIVWTTLGRQPKQDDLRRPLSAISARSYCDRFGSWRKALEAFVGFVNMEPTIPDERVDTAEASDCIRTAREVTVNRRTSRTISWRLRFLVMRRDNFKCRLCGVSPALQVGTVLVVDHVIPWSGGGESVLENLQTLCNVCNGGKSDLTLVEPR